MIMLEMVGVTFAVHDGRKFVPVFVSENMVGHRLESFLLQELIEDTQEVVINGCCTQ